MNPWKRIHTDFKVLVEEEYKIVQQGGLQEFCYAYVTYRESGEVDSWVESVATEGLLARFELVATEAGIALGVPTGTLPRKYWLYQLFLDLRANNSSHVRIHSDTAGIIERLFEASAIYGARLDRQWLEKSPTASGGYGVEQRALTPCEENKGAAALETGGEETPDERSKRRIALVMPILRSKKWKRGTWATKAGVSKNSVYEYLNGKRDLSIENRQALAEELGLKPEELRD